MKRATHLGTLTLVAFTGLSACSGPMERYAAPSGGVMADEIPVADSAHERGLQNWLVGFKPRAMAAGISERTWQRSVAIIRYNPKVIERDRYQAEFTKPVWEYLDSAVSDSRIENGRAMLAQHRDLLNAIEARYGVDKEVVVAVWGMESNYGKNRGKTLILPALATLAYDGRRGAFFQQQFLDAMKIIQAGDTDPMHLTGSWAGAMGHTQFIPSSYLSFAVDFTGDGKRDIWSDNPADALASTAAYLARSGWTRGQPWGVEVTLPAGFNYGLGGKKVKKTPAEWAALGVRGVNGAVPNYGPASILLPAGSKGPAIMIFGNFAAISRYNAANSYVMGVGLLSDRLKGRGGLVAPWPRDGRALSSNEKQELQQRLTALGYDTQGTDGMIGQNTIDALVAWQRANGMAPDGYATIAVLERLRRG
ncbi:lytic murein transglycosylase [Paenirhodobacter sp.]|uniref:lytic murein transglycosylase n=1 Tax=Paenirhodobacter sp. TaxID=1965326 RepID=UPI003B3CA11A